MLASILFFFLTAISVAQGAAPPPPMPPPPPGLPIDSNILILLAVALIYGSVKVFRSTQKSA